MSEYPEIMPKMPPWRTLLTLSVISICGGISVLQAAPALLPLATARLIAAPTPHDGVWAIGVEIALKEHAITYWRDPGEAGVPPTFDFTASTNVKNASVAFPIPKRIHEGDIDAIGYEGTVVFPVRVALTDGAMPAAVHLQLAYATCERICLPAHADLVLTLPPPPDAIDARAIAHALAAVPRVLDGAQAGAIAAVTDETHEGHASWRVVPTEHSATTTLFAEAPEGFFVSTKKDADGFRVDVVDHPAGQPKPPSIRFTLVTEGSGVEFTAPTRP